jgi:transcriptional regulator with XRE-family HTH domain
MNFVEYLKNRLAEPGWTQPAAAAKARIEQSYLSKLETGKPVPSEEVCQRLVEAFGINTAARVSAQLPIRTRQKSPAIQFFDTVDPRSEPTDLSASLAGKTWQGPRSHYFSRGRSNDWTGDLVICQETGQRCLVMPGNCVRAEIVYPETAAPGRRPPERSAPYPITSSRQAAIVSGVSWWVKKVLSFHSSSMR